MSGFGLPLDPGLREQAEDWLAEDPDPQTRATLTTLLEQAEAAAPTSAAAATELASAFAGPLEFGTAGLRGPMGPGPARMNRVVVTRAAAGLARWLTQWRLTARVLVGHDARHGSERFARDTAEILAGAGHEVVLLDGPVPTPLVAFGLLNGERPAHAAVVVTASHNPAADNGYKVYVGGSQIIPPVDAEIAEAIAHESAEPLAALPRRAVTPTDPEPLLAAYVARAAAAAPETDSSVSPVRWVHTAMHGVGAPLVRRVTAAAGLPEPIEVAAQAEPDPDFPTVPFPNPEEAGAMDLALDLAAEQGADVVIANDPDADRCAVAVPGADPHDRAAWRLLTGDELGLLLGDDALRRGVPGVFAASVVSGSALERLVRSAGREFVTTLTGFKWIGRVPDLAFGYEEAIGYCCDPHAVADKDGITAALRVLQMVARFKASGRTLTDRLDELAAEHGLISTAQVSIRTDDPETISRALTSLRQTPPTRLLGETVGVTDLADPSRPGPADATVGLPPTDAVILSGHDFRAVIRPSGTEPKLKIYLETRHDPVPPVELHRVRSLEQDRLGLLGHEVTSILGLREPDRLQEN